MPKTLEEALALIKTLEGEKTTLSGKVTELETAVTAKDTRIGELEKITTEQGVNFKKLRDMSEKEKEQYTEKELDLMKRQEALQEQQDALAKDQTDFKTKQRDTAIGNAINKYARGDVELAKKIRANFDSIKDSEGAFDETAIAPLVEKGVNMLGAEAPDPLRTAHNTAGFEGQVPENSFANSAEGQSLASKMGIDISDKPAPTA